MVSRTGITSITINGEIKHITDLSPLELCAEWTKLKHEIDELKSANEQAYKGWRGVILKLIEVNLSVRKNGFFLIQAIQN